MALEKNSMTTEVDRAPDLGFQARADRLDKLFEDVAMSLTNLIIDYHSVLRKETKKCELSAATMDELMHAWLSEITFLFIYKKFVGAEFIVEISNAEDGEYHLNATISGDTLNETRYVVNNHIKSVLVKEHKLIQEENGDWTANIYVYL